MNSLLEKTKIAIQEGKITSITDDSRKAAHGSLFVATVGSKQDGHDFIQNAIDQGAEFVVGQKKFSHPKYFETKDSKEFLGEIASYFYGHPSHSMKVIGITGTSGKTTCAYLLHSILSASNEMAGMIGTVEIRLGNESFQATQTTPGVLETQEYLARMKKAGCTSVVMEVSSHALDQKRAVGIAWDGVLFLNLSPEHLDYHANLEEYFSAKKRLFQEHLSYSVAVGKNPVGVIDCSTAAGKKLFNECEMNLISGAKISKTSESDLKSSVQGIRGKVGAVSIQSDLMGAFNVSNLTAVTSLAEKLKIPSPQISKGISDLKSVPGRLEKVPNAKGVQVFVDYAHKPDALEKVLETVRAVRDEGRGGRIILVFGCGGDRDRTKRPVMGAIALQLADCVIVTSDNPRTENPFSILEEIKSGMDPKNTNAEFIVDRKEAIRTALEKAAPGDFVLIAGKGHEDYQIIGVKKNPFDDRKVALEIGMSS